MPNPTISRASISPSRQLLFLVPKKADGTSALGAISAVAPTATLTVDGVPTTLSYPIWSTGWGSVAFPTCPPRSTSLVDDSDGGFASSGTATVHTPGTGAAPYFDANDAVNASYRTFAGPSDSATWTLSSPHGGRYWIGAHVLDLVDPANTARAVYTARDASGNLLGTFTADLTARPAASLRRSVSGRPFLYLGHVVVPDASSTITVTLTNGGTSGSLIPADAVVLVSDFVFAPAAGAVVTVTLGSGAATVAGVATDAATLTVATDDDSTFLGPIHPPGERTSQVGYNVDFVHEESIAVCLADRGYASNVWGSGATLDAHFDMATCTGNVARTLAWGVDDGITPGGHYLLGDGLVRVRARYSGATFDDAARSRIGLTSYPDCYTFGAAAWTDLGGGSWEMAVQVARVPRQPISQRTAANTYLHNWNPLLNFYSNNPGLLVREWQWFDGDTPASYTGTAHPRHVARLKGKVGAIRSMDLFGTNGSASCNVGDFMSPADRCPPDQSTGVEYYPASSLIRAIAPATFDDADRYVRWNDVPDGASSFVIATVDDTTAWVGRDGTSAGLYSPTQDYPSNVAGVNVRMANCLSLVVIDGTHLLLNVNVDTTYDTGTSGSPVRATLAASHDLSTSGASLYVAKTDLMGVERFCAYCSDLDASPWINVPHAATDALVDWMADRVIEGTPDGRKVYVEYSNEHWNNFGQNRYFSLAAKHANWRIVAGEITGVAGYGNGSEWFAHQTAHVADRFRARFVAAGRSGELVVCVLGTQLNYQGITAILAGRVVAEGLRIDAVSPSSYQAIGPNGTDPAFSGPDLAQSFARLDAGGNIDVLAESTLRATLQGVFAGHIHEFAVRGRPGMKLAPYEGGTDYPTWSNEDYGRAVYLAPEMISHPRMYRLAAAFESMCQDCGVIVNNRYKLEATGEIGSNHTWTEHYGITPPYGTGDPSENVDWSDFPNARSQLMGGRMAWASGVDFASTSEQIMPTFPFTDDAASVAAGSIFPDVSIAAGSWTSAAVSGPGGTINAVYATSTAGGVAQLASPAADDAGGDVSVVARVFRPAWDASQGLYLAARSAADVANGARYQVNIDLQTGGMTVYRITTGATSLATMTGITFPASKLLEFALSAVGTTLTVTAQDLTDGTYLQPGGTWTATPANALSAVDGAPIAVAGYGAWGTSTADDTKPVYLTRVAFLSAGTTITTTSDSADRRRRNRLNPQRRRAIAANFTLPGPGA